MIIEKKNKNSLNELARIISSQDIFFQKAILQRDSVPREILDLLYFQGEQSLRPLIVSKKNISVNIVRNIALSSDEMEIREFLKGESPHKNQKWIIEELIRNRLPNIYYIVASSMDLTFLSLTTVVQLIKNEDILRGYAANPTVPEEVLAYLTGLDQHPSIQLTCVKNPKISKILLSDMARNSRNKNVASLAMEKLSS